MDKSCNGQQAKGLTTQFRESTYRALSLLRRKAKRRQIAGKPADKRLFSRGLYFLRASGQAAARNYYNVNLSEQGSQVFQLRVLQ